MKFEIFKDDVGEWRWRLVARNGRIVADSGEGYKNKADCVAEMGKIRTAMRGEMEIPGAD